MRLRYSLRTAFIAMTVVAAFCFWRSRPAVIAQRFVDAINNSDYAAADALFSQDEFRFVVHHQEWHRRNKIRASRSRQSLADWLIGKCRVSLSVETWTEAPDTPTDGNNHTMYTIRYDMAIDATALGMQKPPDPFSAL